MSGVPKRGRQLDWPDEGLTGTEWLRHNDSLISMVVSAERAERTRTLAEQEARRLALASAALRPNALHRADCAGQGCRMGDDGGEAEVAARSDSGKHVSHIIVLKRN